MDIKQIRAIEAHGNQLKTIFGLDDIDPLELCQKLKRLEAAGERIALHACNVGYESDEAWEAEKEKVLNKVDKLLDFRARGIPVFLNGDPRGYALKIRDEYVRDHSLSIYQDWGGYGILSPEF